MAFNALALAHSKKNENTYVPGMNVYIPKTKEEKKKEKQRPCVIIVARRGEEGSYINRVGGFA